MNFLRKLFRSFQESDKDKQINKQPVNLSLDDSFVHHFINKGGKFLYSTKIDEVTVNLNHILVENNWNEVVCNDFDLLTLLKKTKVKVVPSFKTGIPVFIPCEHLIANSGEILLSSNQIGGNKLPSLSDDFIVYATTSQLVKNIGEGLTGIKMNFKGNIPTNICSIKKYVISEVDDILSHGNSNSKNLYLLLFEDL